MMGRRGWRSRATAHGMGASSMGCRDNPTATRTVSRTDMLGTEELRCRRPRNHRLPTAVGLRRGRGGLFKATA